MSQERPAILRVAVAAPLPRLFDYLRPADCDPARLCPGLRVRVPFGGRCRVGMIVALAAHSDQPPERLKPIAAVLDPQPLLGPSDLELILWTAAYYQYPPGDALFTALPARLRRPEALPEPGEPGWRLTAAGRVADPSGLARAPRQAQVAALLADQREGRSAAEIRRRAGDCAHALSALERRGWIERCRAPASPSLPAIQAASGPTLNADQTQAVAEVRAALGGFRTFLLEGVTGSGKTEVYLHLIQAAIESGRQTLMLVPEIGLTPQLARRLVERIPGPMVTLHSGLAAGERERAWRQAADGGAVLVLGTRSAVFVPLPRLGLILVDEEHDASFKQQDGLRYSARDLAVRRAQQAGCPVVLGSATPSLETLYNTRAGRYARLALPERAGGARPPEIALLDVRAQPLRAGLSPVLVRLTEEQLAAGNQVLLFLNRRGFAPVLTCHACGWVGDCPKCDARLTLHLAERRLWCHHCGLTRPLPAVCPDCGDGDLRTLGLGTERLETELQGLFPGTPLARVDRDSTRRKGSLERILAAARRGEVPLLVGTQMLAKGHHFPGVTLVGLLDVDQGLYGADFRSAERMAQLVVQVAGRAGRAERPGRVILQTRHPDHPLLHTLRRSGYRAFAEAALAEREAAGLPPFAYQALMRAEARDPETATGFLRSALDLAGALLATEVQLFGPVPAPMERRAGRYRAQLLVQASHRPMLQRFLGVWLEAVRGLRPAPGVRWSLDVDPLDLM
ncbi:MAG: primosomal protein N' [Chromatiaceae bacterium]|jgi:primosomal protein N' (replication factor Y)|nr:primosomal protein N' [Chromatiaceae bacterium]